MTVEDDWTAGLPEDLLAEIEAAQPGTVAARSVPFRVPVQLGLPGLGASALQPLRTVGPVAGLAAKYWFEFFGPIEAYTVYAGGESLPSLVLTEARLPRLIFPPHPGSSYTVEISGGSVWILAAALDPALPGDRYVGFTVASGSLAFLAAPALTGQRLTLAGALEATLEVALATPDPPAPDAGQCQADVSVTPQASSP